MRQTFFVADLHLDRERPHIIAAFCRFLKEISRTADALYILGDLFEYWIGDDDPATGLDEVLHALRDLSVAGTSMFFVHGNRDFLVGKSFAKFTRCTILPETSIIDLYGTPVAIMHGDSLCTDDVAYQRYRARVRNKWVRKALLLLGTKQRLKIAARLRNKSMAATAGKHPEIMDVNQAAVEQVMLNHGVRYLIHGHTHRPAIHDFIIDGKAYKRIVLGDWYEQGNVLICSPEGMELEKVEAL